MNRTQTGRRAAIGATALLLAAGGLALSLPSAEAIPAGVTVRVEGPHSTLVPPTLVVTVPGSVVKDGVAADSCSARSAAGALERATKGNWKGTWSKSLKGYFVDAIDGVAPAGSADFWAFWIDDKPASAGICGVDPHPGQSILFFIDCYGKTCPKNAGVLGATAPAVVRPGRPFSVAVTAYADSNGKPSPEAGASISGGGANATTGAGGSARITLGHTGRVTLRISAPHAVRTEVSVCVARAGSTGCGARAF